MAFTGLAAVVAAALQATVLPPRDIDAFVRFWVVVAALGGAVCATDLVLGSRLQREGYVRRCTLPVVAQFVPALLAGAAVTVALLRLDHPAPALLPGLWAAIWGLGVFASRPYLPRAIGWVALYYLAAGACLLWHAADAALPSPWAMGLTFGIGQGALALVLHLNLERNDDGQED
jgi:hypothetical protein